MAITYTPTTNFGAKDSLPTNDPAKVIKGSEFTTEFTAIQTAFGLAAPAASPTFTGTVTIASVDINGGTVDGTPIGANSASTGAFTTLTASGNVNFDSGTFFVDASADAVGIGTSSPSSYAAAANNLVIADSGNAGMTIASGTTSEGALYFADGTSGGDVYRGVLWYNHANNFMGFSTDTTERMRIDSSGNVGIGSTSPGAKLQINDASEPKARFVDTTDFYYTDYGRDGIDAYTNTNGSAPIFFKTGGSEKMRLDASGNLLVGTTGIPNGTSVYGAAFEASTGDRMELNFGTSSTSNLYAIRFFNPNGDVGSVRTSGSATSFNTSSDARLKKNIADAEDAGAKVDAIKVRQFDWKADGSHQDYGMIAQELLTVAPEAVSGDPESDEMMGVDYSKLVPMMLKEIQALRARVAALEA